MEEKTVIVTGGNSGLGYQCSKNIASKNENYHIVIACRNPKKAEIAKEKLKQESGNQNIYSITLDLSSLESIRKSYDEFVNLNIPKLYGIVCNAGFNREPVEYTKDGFEATFGALHLGHFLFTNLMLRQIRDDGRIVFVSSDMHNPPKIVCKYTPTFHNAEELAYPGINGALSDKELSLRYPMAKLCNILCVNEMSDRLQAESDKKVTVNAFNPGLMTDTNFMPENTNIIVKHLLPIFATVLSTVIGQKGSGIESGKGLANLITEDKFEGITRKYFDRNNETPVETSPQAQDKKAGEKLWKESTELVNLKENETILSIK